MNPFAPKFRRGMGLWECVRGVVTRLQVNKQILYGDRVEEDGPRGHSVHLWVCEPEVHREGLVEG